MLCAAVPGPAIDEENDGSSVGQSFRRINVEGAAGPGAEGNVARDLRCAGILRHEIVEHVEGGKTHRRQRDNGNSEKPAKNCKRGAEHDDQTGRDGIRLMAECDKTAPSRRARPGCRDNRCRDRSDRWLPARPAGRWEVP